MNTYHSESAEAIAANRAEREELARPDKPVVPLVGEDGNAFAILGRWKAAARVAGWAEDEITAVMSEAMSGDYDHLLATVMDNSEEPD